MAVLFPKSCVICGNLSLQALCPACEIEWERKHLLLNKHISRTGDEIVSCSQYNGLGGKIIRSFKYGKRFDLLYWISKAMVQGISEFSNAEFTFIIPVPQSFRKIFTRGFHPVEMIGNQVSSMTSIPVNLRLLKRKWEWREKDQAGLSRLQRLGNLSHSFYALKKEEWREKNTVLLIDDVATTGTTVHRCKYAIKRQYPEWQVHILVFAHG